MLTSSDDGALDGAPDTVRHMPPPLDRPPSPPPGSTPAEHRKRHHHGNLRAAALDALDQLIRDDGVGSVTLRTLAARTGVSHTALLHHFGTLHGLFTAFACMGFDLLGDRLTTAGQGGGDALDIGVQYVAFSVDYPAHFRVMFDPALLVADDAALTAARDSAFAVLRRSVDELDNAPARSDAAAAVIAGWSLMHGLAVLSASGNLEAAHIRNLVAQDDLLALARRAGGMLFGSPGH